MYEAMNELKKELEKEYGVSLILRAEGMHYIIYEDTAECMVIYHEEKLIGCYIETDFKSCAKYLVHLVEIDGEPCKMRIKVLTYI